MNNYNSAVNVLNTSISFINDFLNKKVKTTIEFITTFHLNLHIIYYAVLLYNDTIEDSLLALMPNMPFKY